MEIGIYPRTELAKSYFARLIDRPDRALSLFGPRQIGKTTFLTHDLARAAKEAHVTPLYVDLMLSKQPLKSINAALTEEIFKLRSRKLKQPVKSLGLLGASVTMEAPAQAPSSSDDGIALRHLAAELLALSGERRFLLMLDEFQEMVRLGEAGVQAIKAIRALFNQYKTTGKFLLLMTGSSQAELIRLFASPTQASFGLADREDFQPLGMAYVQFAVDRANLVRAAKAKLSAQALYPIFTEQLHHRPADLEAFIGYLSTYTVETLEAACQHFLAKRYPATDTEARFKNLTALQKVVLTMLANGAAQLTSKLSIATIAAKLGNPVTAGAIQKALTSLPVNTLTNPSRGVYRFEDKALESWLQTSQS